MLNNYFQKNNSIENLNHDVYQTCLEPQTDFLIFHRCCLNSASRTIFMSTIKNQNQSGWNSLKNTMKKYSKTTKNRTVKKRYFEHLLPKSMKKFLISILPTVIVFLSIFSWTSCTHCGPRADENFQLLSYLSDSKNQTIIDKVLLANDRGN